MDSLPALNSPVRTLRTLAGTYGRLRTSGKPRRRCITEHDAYLPANSYALVQRIDHTPHGPVLVIEAGELKVRCLPEEVEPACLRAITWMQAHGIIHPLLPTHQVEYLRTAYRQVRREAKQRAS